MADDVVYKEDPATAEQVVGLGRLVSVDPRDKQHQLPRKAAPRTITSRYWFCCGVLDQGSTSQCVAYSGTKYLTSGPIVNKAPFTPKELYDLCQKADEWEGEDYDGTSVRACFKVFKQEGLVESYKWTYDAETIINHLLTTGPVAMGTDWFIDMANPGRDNFLRPTGESLGGHAYLLIGANRNKKCPDGSKGAVRILNSWGTGWADKGRAWMSFTDLATLIANDPYAEACVAIEKKK